MKLCRGKFRLDIRKTFFTQRVAGHCNRFPGEVVTAPRLIELRKCWDNALRHTVILGMVLCRARSWIPVGVLWFWERHSSGARCSPESRGQVCALLLIPSSTGAFCSTGCCEEGRALRQTVQACRISQAAAVPSQS